MIIDFNNQHALVKYRLLSNTITPRPIAWVSSFNDKGLINVAPFSFFGVVSVEPAIVSICFSPKSDNSLKDTLQNALDSSKLTINLPTLSHLDKLEKSSSELDSNISEASTFDIGLRIVLEDYPPIIDDIHIAYFCNVMEVLEFGTYNKTLLLTIEGCFVEDSIYRDDLRFSPPHLGRVGKLYLNPAHLINTKPKKPKQ